MSHKWKSLLTNWINCFFQDQETEENITIKSLLKVVTHLHKNFCPNAIKPSSLEAITLEEFIRENYPVFTFENGAVQIASETEIHYAASLLLFFVCVNSKDTDVKNAMCNNLNDEQQEMVLKFNKCLMKCSSVTYKDVEYAIREACGKNSSVVELSNSVTETPPALRSLHNEVQRLRAALDAERFDKNYLQEELARTNSTLSKVSKEKDKYKEEILMLNSRIASDFEENNKMQTQSSGRKQMNARLKRQQEELEQRLLDTQLMLEEVQNECDSHKSKVEELQAERDKWRIFGEAETNKVQQLTEYLDKEKAERESLLQLVSELRQHNKQIALDSSQLECDDPDVSVQSEGVSFLTCNEVCANVVEVQLGEERARITTLTENLQALQDQMRLLKETTSKEKIITEAKLSQKTTELQNLKEQLNLEIEEKIKIIESKNNEISKLSNQINELQQKMNDIIQNSKYDLENKNKEIQTLQEEKISLIQSFTKKVTRMENVIQEKDLTIQSAKVDLDTELKSKSILKDEYDKSILELNKKLADVDREIVDLQNLVLEKTNELENTKASLQKQTELYKSLEVEHSSLQDQFKGQQIKFHDICCELKDKSETLERFSSELKEKDHKILQLTERCSELGAVKEKLLNNIEEVNKQKCSLEVELNNNQSMFSDEKNELEMALSQKDAALAILSLDLEQEIKIKSELLKEVELLKNNNHNLYLEIQSKVLELKEANNTLISKIQELKNVTYDNESLEQSVILLNKNKQELIDQLKEKTDDLITCESIVKELENNKIVVHNELRVVETQLSEERARAVELMQNLKTLQSQMRSMEEKAETDTEEKSTLEEKLLEKTTTMENLEHQLDLLVQEKSKLIEQNNVETRELSKQLIEMQQKVNDILEGSKVEMESKLKEIQTLQAEKKMMMQDHSIQIANMETVMKDKDIIIYNMKVDLDTEIKLKLKMKGDYEANIKTLNQKLNNANNEIIEVQNVLAERNNEIKNTKTLLEEQIKTCHNLEIENCNYKSQCELQENKLRQICYDLKEKCNDLKSLNECLINNKEEIDALTRRCAELTEVETELLKEVSEYKVKKKSFEDQLTNIQVAFRDEKNELVIVLAQKEAALATATLSLEREIGLKEELHQEISQLKKMNVQLSAELEQKTKELEHLRHEQKEQVDKLEKIFLTNKDLQQSVISLNKDKEELIAQLKKKSDELIHLESDYKNSSVQFENSKAEKEKENTLLKQQVHDIKQTYSSVIIEKEKLDKDLLAERCAKGTIQKNMEIEIKKLHSKVMELKEHENKLVEIKDLQSQECNMLKGQMKNLEETATKERIILEAKLLEKSKEIENLKHQIETLIHERVDLTKQNNDGISKLNNQLNDTEQKMNEILQNSTRELESKLKEIETLKEENNTLIQNFTTDITKMECIIKSRDITIHNIQVNLDTETNSKLKLKEDYDKHIVNLNQKLSNRNNEVVELQTSLLERSDEVESSKISLHKQIKMYHDLEIDYSSLKLQYDEQQTQLQQICYELKDKPEIIESLKGKFHESEQTICKLNEKYLELTEIHTQVLKNIDDLNTQINSLETELKNAQRTFSEEERKLKVTLKQKDATLAEISLELKNEANLKGELLKQVSQLKDANLKLSSEVEQKNSDIEVIRKKLNSEIKKYEDITAQNRNLEKTITLLHKNKEEIMNKLEKECKERIILESSSKTTVSQLENSKDELQKEILLLKQQLVDTKELCNNLIAEKDSELKQLTEKLAVEKIEKAAIKDMELEVDKLQNELMKSKQESEIKLQEIKDRQSTDHSLVKHQIKILEETAIKEKFELETKLSKKITETDNFKWQIEEKNKLLECNNAEICKLNSQLYEAERKMNDILQKSSLEIENKTKEIQKLQEEISILSQTYTTELTILKNIIEDKDIVIQNIKVVLDTETDMVLDTKQEEDNEQIKILTEKLSYSNHEVAELQNFLLTKISELKSANIYFQKQVKMYQDLETKLSSYKLQYEEQQTKVQELCSELESKSNAVKCLTKKVHDYEEKITQLTCRCSVLSTVEAKYSKQVSELNALKDTFDMELKDVQSTLHDRQRQLEILLTQKATDLEREIENNRELLREITQLKGANEDLSSQLEQKIKELEKMSSTINVQMRELENVNINNRNLEQSIIELNKDKEELVEELKGKCDKLKLLETNNRIIIEQLQQEKTELEKDNVTLKQKIEDMRFSHENILTEKDCTIKQLSEELNAEKNGKTDIPKNVEMGIQMLHDEILKSNQETKFKLQEIKGLHSGEYNLLKTVFRELTNLGDASVDSNVDSKRGLGTIPVENLEKSLDTKDHHLKKCNEKQFSLQKERDQLAQLCRSNESDLVNVKKFLAELCVYITTFKSVREIYTQKLSKIVSLQRTARREIHQLEGKLSDRIICKLERRYAAIMQDLTEFVMNLERWAAKSLEAGLASETIKKAFKSPTSLFCSGSLQNGSLNMQLDELNMAFQRLLEEISLMPTEEMARESQAANTMEIRAEYEDKLNRMKKKMKELYQEQIGIFRERQREDIAVLEKELLAAREKLAESSKAYEEHIRGLTTELWSVGEKFLMKKDEADWLRRRQHSGSLMSLQQMHSTCLTSLGEDRPRASDTHSLRSLQPTRKTDRRGLHVSDEEGEVFDNRCLRELHDTPPANPELRLSELRWRNSLCPPHLKSCYPAETQFAPALDEDDIKSVPGVGGSRQRKEVGITAYKKPGPPTPSKQAGRLSATDSELRESLRAEAELTARKTSTPSRLRALFRRHDTDNSNTPRNKRLSIFRSKK